MTNVIAAIAAAGGHRRPGSAMSLEPPKEASPRTADELRRCAEAKRQAVGHGTEVRSPGRTPTETLNAMNEGELPSVDLLASFRRGELAALCKAKGHPDTTDLDRSDCIAYLVLQWESDRRDHWRREMLQLRDQQKAAGGVPRSRFGSRGSRSHTPPPRAPPVLSPELSPHQAPAYADSRPATSGNTTMPDGGAPGGDDAERRGSSCLLLSTEEEVAAAADVSEVERPAEVEVPSPAAMHAAAAPGTIDDTPVTEQPPINPLDAKGLDGSRRTQSPPVHDSSAVGALPRLNNLLGVVNVPLERHKPVATPSSPLKDSAEDVGVVKKDKPAVKPAVKDSKKVEEMRKQGCLGKWLVTNFSTSAEAKEDTLDFMTVADLRRLEDAFTVMDEDDSGTLDFIELQNLWKSVFPSLSTKKLDRVTGFLFEDIDVNGDDEVNWEELKAYITGTYDSPETAEIAAVVGLTGFVRLDWPVSYRHWVWALVEQPASEQYMIPKLQTLAMKISCVSQLVIVIAVTNMLVEPSFPRNRHTVYHDMTNIIEKSCAIIFTLEFLIRCITCPCSRTDDSRTLLSQKQFWTRGFTWVDILSVIPSYMDWLNIVQDSENNTNFSFLRMVRMVRLVRVLRVMKLGRYSQGIQLLAVAMSRARLAFVWMCMLLCMAVILFAACMFQAELQDSYTDMETGVLMRTADSELKDAGSRIQFQSTIEAMWWSMGTLTGCAYGDVVPQTSFGKAIASCCMVVGLLCCAYPITIITVTFSDVWDQYKQGLERKKRRKRIFGEASRETENEEQQEQQGGKKNKIDELRRRSEKREGGRSKGGKGLNQGWFGPTGANGEMAMEDVLTGVVNHWTSETNKQGAGLQAGSGLASVTSFRVAKEERRQCSNCTNLLLPDAVFCRKCGTKRNDVCACGNVFMDDTVFCRKCGARRQRASPRSVEPAPVRDDAAAAAGVLGAAARGDGPAALRSSAVSFHMDSAYGKPCGTPQTGGSRVAATPASQPTHLPPRAAPAADADPAAEAERVQLSRLRALAAAPPAPLPSAGAGGRRTVPAFCEATATAQMAKLGFGMDALHVGADPDTNAERRGSSKGSGQLGPRGSLVGPSSRSHGENGLVDDN